MGPLSDGAWATCTAPGMSAVARTGRQVRRQAEASRVLEVPHGIVQQRWNFFSCVCAGKVPVAPAVGAVLVCACGPGGRRCGLCYKETQ